MVDTYEMKRQAEDLQANAQHIADNIDELVEQAECWVTIENEGYSDGDEVVEALQQGAAWVEFADDSGLDIEEAVELVESRRLLEEALGVFAEAAEIEIEDHTDAKSALDNIREFSAKTTDNTGVVAAIKLLIEALQDAEILPRTEAVPAASNNTESTNTHSISATSEVEFSPGDSVNSITTNPVNY